MSEFFSDIHGPKPLPIGRFNETGPLPPGQGLEGLFGPLSHINTSRAGLLDAVTPYSSDPSFSQEPSYLEIAHSIPKVVPSMTLPNADGTATFQLTRPVNYGDVAWTMVPPYSDRGRAFVGHAPPTSFGDFPRDPIVNLATANYVLRGLQRWAHMGHLPNKGDPGYYWTLLHHALGNNVYDAAGNSFDTDVLMRLFQPFGVVHGSNQQGGRHYNGGTVTWPVDYVTTIVVDGKVQNLTNYWRHQPVCAGDDLRFVLKFIEEKDLKDKMKYYTLSSVGRSQHTEAFGDAPPGSHEHSLKGAWQFVPETSRGSADPKKTDPDIAHARLFWHAARARVTFGAMPRASAWASATDETQGATGVVLEVTWNPYDCNDAHIRKDKGLPKIVRVIQPAAGESCLQAVWRKKRGKHKLNGTSADITKLKKEIYGSAIKSVTIFRVLAVTGPKRLAQLEVLRVRATQARQRATDAASRVASIEATGGAGSTEATKARTLLVKAEHKCNAVLADVKTAKDKIEKAINAKRESEATQLNTEATNLEIRANTNVKEAEKEAKATEEEAEKAEKAAALAPATSAAPAPGTSAAPASGTSAAPAPGTSAAPASGTSAAPAPATSTTGAGGGKHKPTPAAAGIRPAGHRETKSMIDNDDFMAGVEDLERLLEAETDAKDRTAVTRAKQQQKKAAADPEPPA